MKIQTHPALISRADEVFDLGLGEEPEEVSLIRFFSIRNEMFP